MFRLFEELFESSCPSNYRLHFEMFQNFVERYGGLGPGLPGNEADKGGLVKLQLRCTRMCRSLMKKVSVIGDTQLNFEIQRLLARRLPMSHSSGLNVSGRFSD